MIYFAVHKFKEAESRLPDYMADAIALTQNKLSTYEAPPEYKLFETVNSSERILILVDEAHRTQAGRCT